MCICVYMCVYVYVYIYLCVYMCVCIYACVLYMCIYTCICVYVCVCAYSVRIYALLCVGRSKGNAGIHFKYPKNRDTFEMYPRKVMHM